MYYKLSLASSSDDPPVTLETYIQYINIRVFYANEFVYVTI